MGTNLQAFYKHFYIGCLKTQKQQLHSVKIKIKLFFLRNSGRAHVNRAGRKPVRAGRSAVRNRPSWNTVVRGTPPRVLFASYCFCFAVLFFRVSILNGNNKKCEYSGVVFQNSVVNYDNAIAVPLWPSGYKGAGRRLSITTIDGCNRPIIWLLSNCGGVGVGRYGEGDCGRHPETHDDIHNTGFYYVIERCIFLALRGLAARRC